MDAERFWGVMDKVLHNIFLMLLGISVFFAFMYFVDTNIDPLKFTSNMMNMATYKVIAISHMDDNISVTISNFCKGMHIDEQAACVVSQVAPFYNYSMHNDTFTYSPDEYVEKGGGVCRDSTVLYHTIFSRMGWYIYYDFDVPGHVFLIITKSIEHLSMRCIIDGLTYNCERYEI